MEALLTSSVTSKGQVTIPAKVRKELGIGAGAVVRFKPGEKGSYIIEPLEQDPLDALKGFIGYEGPSISLEDMDEAIAEELAQRHQL